MAETRPPLRSAWVHGGHPRTTKYSEIVDWRRRLNAYLPANYHIVPGTAAISSVHGGGTQLVARIEGRDRAGWTLDGYVIPRLQSGLIYAREVDRPGIGQGRTRPSHPRGRGERIRILSRLDRRSGRRRYRRR
jgi:hypothetical protein